MLTQRFGNRYDNFFKEETNERFLDSEENREFASWATFLLGGETSGAGRDGEGAGDESEPVTSTFTRRTTGGMEEGRESEPIVNTELFGVGDLTRTSLEDCRYWETIPIF